MTVRFRAMGTEVSVYTPAWSPVTAHSAYHTAQDVFQEAERRYSRFRPDSELWQLNHSAGRVKVSSQLFSALKRARLYFELTEGLFDITVGSALLSLGYARSFGELPASETPAEESVGNTSAGHIELDDESRTVTRPVGATLDLGGFIKGQTVDRVARLLPANVLVDAGGDMMCRGDGPNGRGWMVDVEDPQNPEHSLMTLRIQNAAVATSASNRRRWSLGGAVHHHLIDPRVMRSSASDLAQVTVITTGAEVADVFAKTAFFMGTQAAQKWLSTLPHVAAVLVTQTGAVEMVGRFSPANSNAESTHHWEVVHG
ncbi:MAG: FAD:protein FMN transferase [Polyangiaceae bacterium]|nr:FAD:protein FMN transferase [Polyangiaceae bacterium]